MKTYTAAIQKLKRQYLPEDFAITNWEALEPWFKELLERPVDSKETLEKWLADLSELEAVLSEDVCWR